MSEETPPPAVRDLELHPLSGTPRVGAGALALICLSRRGTMYRRLQDFDLAVEDFLKALDMMSEHQEELVQQAQRQLLLAYNDFAVHCYCLWGQRAGEGGEVASLSHPEQGGSRVGGKGRNLAALP